MRLDFAMRAAILAVLVFVCSGAEGAETKGTTDCGLPIEAAKRSFCKEEITGETVRFATFMREDKVRRSVHDSGSTLVWSGGVVPVNGHAFGSASAHQGLRNGRGDFHQRRRFRREDRAGHTARPRHRGGQGIRPGRGFEPGMSRPVGDEP